MRPLVLSGAIATGRSILAAQAMGADLAYVGTRFIATKEANADPAYKQAVVASSAEDIIYSAYFTGVPGNYLRPSILAAGLGPDSLQAREKRAMSFADRKAAETFVDQSGPRRRGDIAADSSLWLRCVDRVLR